MSQRLCILDELLLLMPSPAPPRTTPVSPPPYSDAPRAKQHRGLRRVQARGGALCRRGHGRYRDHIGLRLPPGHRPRRLCLRHGASVLLLLGFRRRSWQAASYQASRGNDLLAAAAGESHAKQQLRLDSHILLQIPSLFASPDAQAPPSALDLRGPLASSWY